MSCKVLILQNTSKEHAKHIIGGSVERSIIITISQHMSAFRHDTPAKPRVNIEHNN